MRGRVGTTWVRNSLACNLRAALTRPPCGIPWVSVPRPLQRRRQVGQVRGGRPVRRRRRPPRRHRPANPRSGSLPASEPSPGVSHLRDFTPGTLGAKTGPGPGHRATEGTRSEPLFRGGGHQRAASCQAGDDAGPAPGGHRPSRFVLGARFLSRLRPDEGAVTSFSVRGSRVTEGKEPCPRVELLESGRVQIGPEQPGF